ncbi:MAG: phosphoglycerate dehydrogenase [Gemmatimonadota bacterium]|nr:MAG: phosphoglycerate dehydrogenase [Gemmatimonadota bacterium]
MVDEVVEVTDDHAIGTTEEGGVTAKTTFIIDFDNTLVRTEGLEELATIALADHPERAALLGRIKTINDEGLDGKISVQESLHRRLELFRPHRDHLEPLVEVLKKKISPSFRRNRSFFAEHRDRTVIVTNGFIEYVAPVVAELGIPRSQVYANRFEYSADGNIVGFDHDLPLAAGDGKVAQVRALTLDAPVCVLGSGVSDLRIREAGVADRFVAYTETMASDAVLAHADDTAADFDEFLEKQGLPRALSFPKAKIRVILLEGVHEDAAKAFAEEGYSVEQVPGSPGPDVLRKLLAEASILGVRSKTELTAPLLAEARRLLVVGSFCIGTDRLDLDACSQRGVAVFNAPYSNTRSVVELTLAETIMLMRDVPSKNTGMHAGHWRKSATGAHEVRGKRLGIVGYGNIGSQLSVLAESLGMRVFYYDIVEKLALGNATKCRSLSELLEISDAVSVHVDGRPENRGLFGANEFGRMRDGAVFLNLSRGFVVDMTALRAALESGRLKGAAIDVFPDEPPDSDETFESDLRGLPMVILTPHIGGSTTEAQHNIAAFVSERIIQYINTGDTSGSVNIPNIQLPAVQGFHRFLHVHENVPGVLAKINGTLGDNGINIEGQYLKTNEAIGYVITDVDRRYDDAVIKKLRRIDGTIRFRVLY